MSKADDYDSLNPCTWVCSPFSREFRFALDFLRPNMIPARRLCIKAFNNQSERLLSGFFRPVDLLAEKVVLTIYGRCSIYICR